MVRKIIVYSRSREKTAEAEEVLNKLNIEVVSLENAGVGNLDRIREAAGNTGELVFLEIANLTGECCICDDCTLAVNALNGYPGFAAGISTAGQDADEVLDDILSAMKRKEPSDRRALMTCVLIFARPCGEDKKQEAEMFMGEVRGRILLQKTPEQGTDFDRIFLPDGSEKALSELSIAEKNRISHVGEALHKLAAYLTRE